MARLKRQMPDQVTERYLRVNWTTSLARAIVGCDNQSYKFTP